MAAPAKITRGVPDGIMLEDGFRALLACVDNTTLTLWEKAVKLPALDGGDGIDLSTMHSVKYHRMAPRQLIKTGEVTAVCGYDPKMYVDLLALLNVESTWCITWNNGDAVSFFAFLQKAEPSELKEGEMPEVTITLVLTNWDKAGNVEAGPMFYPATGT